MLSYQATHTKEEKTIPILKETRQELSPWIFFLMFSGEHYG